MHSILVHTSKSYVVVGMCSRKVTKDGFTYEAQIPYDFYAIAYPIDYQIANKIVEEADDYTAHGELKLPIHSLVNFVEKRIEAYSDNDRG